MSIVYDDTRYSSLMWTSNLASILSLAGEVWIFYIFFKTWKLWTYSGKMILCMTLSYFFYTLANLLNNFDERKHSNLCQVNGFLRNFGILSAFFWSWKISKSAYAAMTDPDFTSSAYNELVLLMKGFLYPAIFALPPLISHILGFKYFVYGFKNLSCGVTSESGSENVAFFVFVFYVVVPASLLLISTMYYSVKIIKFIKMLPGSMKISPMRFLTYPITLFILWTPTLFFSYLFHLDKYIFWLDVLRIFTTQSVGFFHSLIYGVQSKVLAKIEQEKQNEISTEIGLLEGSMWSPEDADLDQSLSHYVM